MVSTRKCEQPVNGGAVIDDSLTRPDTGCRYGVSSCTQRAGRSLSSVVCRRFANPAVLSSSDPGWAHVRRRSRAAGRLPGQRRSGLVEMLARFPDESDNCVGQCRRECALSDRSMPSTERPSSLARRPFAHSMLGSQATDAGVTGDLLTDNTSSLMLMLTVHMKEPGTWVTAPLTCTTARSI